MADASVTVVLITSFTTLSCCLITTFAATFRKQREMEERLDAAEESLQRHRERISHPKRR